MPGEPEIDSFITLSAFMGGCTRANASHDFQGGHLTAVLGGCELDLRRASISKGQAVIEVSAIMGGIQIKVPTDWYVSLQGTPILGGFDDKTFHPQGELTKRLIISGEAIMGGVDITN